MATSFAQTEIEAFLEQQTQQYQQHLTTRNKTIKTLRHQNNIKAYRTIPKLYLPPKTPELIIQDTTLSRQFDQQYESLFFDNLDKVITQNTITLELENARLRHIIQQTEKHLTTVTAPTNVITQLHCNFLTRNNITDHDILPELQRTLHNDCATAELVSTPTDDATTSTITNPSTIQQTQLSKHRQRRKSSHHHPKGNKQHKPNRFLAKRPPNETVT